METFKAAIGRQVTAIDAVIEAIYAINPTDDAAAEELSTVVDTLVDARTSLENIVKFREAGMGRAE
jgi:hypothetical protein